MYRKLYVVPIALALALVLGMGGFRATGAAAGAKDPAADERERAIKAGEVLSEIMQIPEEGIPARLMEGAEAVAVIPHVVKGAFGIGGQFGKGLVSERTPDGRWSAPSYIKIAGGNFGLQLGLEATDLVLVFTDHDGFDGLLQGKVKLGADVGVAAGPVGRNAQAGTDVLLKSGVLAYSRSKGLFAGISLDGSVVSIDEDANRTVYGREIPAKNILSGTVHKNQIVMPFVQVLEQYSPVRKRATD
jgi:SH3 domain-containing YSC84-like protein 1